MKLCIKCGSSEHTNRNCKGYVTSFGLIVFTQGNPKFSKGRIYPFSQVNCPVHQNANANEISYNEPSINNELLFLLVERKDTVGFLNIVQGSYPELEPHKSRKLMKYFYELTCLERENLVQYSFDKLWDIAGSPKRDKEKARRKFEQLNIISKINSSHCFHREADYIMPKGRLKYGESTRQCALREFQEETGYNKNDVELLDIPPYEEEFVGTDGKNYRNVFYVAKLKLFASINVKLGDDPSQSKEVANIGWFNIKECLYTMRDYHQDKKDILLKVYDLLKHFKFSNKYIENPTNKYSFNRRFADNYSKDHSNKYSHKNQFMRRYYFNEWSHKQNLQFLPNRWNSHWSPNTYGTMRNHTLINASKE